MPVLVLLRGQNKNSPRESPTFSYAPPPPPPFPPECKLYSACAQFQVATMHWTNLSAKIEAEHLVSWLILDRGDEQWKLLWIRHHFMQQLLTQNRGDRTTVRTTNALSGQGASSLRSSELYRILNISGRKCFSSLVISPNIAIHLQNT